MRAEYERDGFLVLEGTGCDESVIDGAVADLDDLYEGEGHRAGGVNFYEHRIQDAWRISANVLALALSPEIHALLNELYGREPLPFQTLNFRKGSEQRAHSDTIHFNSTPPGFMCGIWVALEEIDMENGPLVYYPGSHRLPEFTMEDVGVEARQDQYPHYERFIADEIDRRRLAPAYGTIGKGQAIVWSANLLHGGMPQRDPARTRHSLVTHYFFEGCRFYTPMTSGKGHVEWRDPTWVVPEEASSEESAPYSPASIRARVVEAVPEGATVLVVSKGDESLLGFEGRTGWHFPREEPWNHPADASEAVAGLDALRSEGASHLVLPAVSEWWLEHYEGLVGHLESHGHVVARDEHCVIFSLD
jgi:Phytanoyl-CoA dioxygenase (PhyH)